MSEPETQPRSAADACPGLSRPFLAADGAIVRLRTGGLPISVSSLQGLMSIVAHQSDPSIQLTSRGALQIRGLAVPLEAETRDAVVSTGLVPSPSHELVRNVVVSPLTGLDGDGYADLRPLVRDLDSMICADPGLAALPGRFLFALDDGRGDVIGQSFDLGLIATGPHRVTVLAGSADRGWSVPLTGAADLLIDLAQDFVRANEASGGGSWHVAELDRPIGTPTDCSHRPRDAGAAPVSRPLGAVGDHAVVGVPLGLLTPAHLEALASCTDRVGITPWRSLVIENGAAALPRLATAGLTTSAASPWVRLHACTGSPGCARSTLDTRSLARHLAPRLPVGLLPVHVSGCERRCGTPTTPFVDLLAPKSVDAALELITMEDR
ncbi:precorrin-3B synthase [Humibacillus sp. DSM 29435]|uniref:precorrin-3B synthase n=1 Tax=Humibacillus sp. DSM 29435 TaxID=1869167 RepID=UPI0020C805D3|nr:precorrin-3B synthase [Humibacillus sp. DSM 29435]